MLETLCWQTPGLDYAIMVQLKNLLSHSYVRPPGPHHSSPVTSLGEGDENRETAVTFGLYSGVQTESLSPSLVKVNALITGWVPQVARGWRSSWGKWHQWSKKDIYFMRVQAGCQISHLMRPDSFSPKITETINEMVRKAKGRFCKVSVQLLLCNIFLKLKNASQVYDLM